MRPFEDAGGPVRLCALPMLAMLSLALASCKSTTAPVNEPPTFTLTRSDVTVLENSEYTSIPDMVTAFSPGPASESSQTLAGYTVTSSNSGLFRVQPVISPAGTLSFTLAADSFGIDTAKVTATDNGGTANGGVASTSHTFTITVTHVNQPPRFTIGANETVWHKAGPQTVPNWATHISPGPPNEPDQTLEFELGSSDSTLFSVQPAMDTTGTLTFTPDPAATGTDTVSVTARDDGGTANGGVDSTIHKFTITVAPTFTIGPSQVVWHEAGPQTMKHWVSDIVGGPLSDSGQALAFTVTSSDSALFSVQPAISPDGTLTFTPDTAADGTATVSVTLKDFGGTGTGAVDSTEAQESTIGVAPVALVTNYGDDIASATVSVIDVASETVVNTIPVYGVPLEVAFAPDSIAAYMVNYGMGTVDEIDVATDTVLHDTGPVIVVAPSTFSRSIRVGGEPLGIAFTPDGTKAYLTSVIGYTVAMIDMATGTASQILDEGLYDADFAAVAFAPDGSKAYVTNAGAPVVGDRVWVVDGATDTVTQKIPVGSRPEGVAFTADGSKAYVTNYGSGTVSVIDVATSTVIQTIPVGTHPWGVAFTPDGTKAYVANYDDNSVSAIDVATGTVVQTIAVGTHPMRIAVPPDGMEAYVTNHGSNSVSVIDVATDVVLRTIPVGAAPWGVAIR